jgi:hypothetical protein
MGRRERHSKQRALPVEPSEWPEVSSGERGVLFAFDAVSMNELYSSVTCTSNDTLNPATKYSVPTVADGYAYLGTQGPLQSPGTCTPPDNPTAACFNSGTFYVFGPFSNRSCS